MLWGRYNHNGAFVTEHFQESIESSVSLSPKAFFYEDRFFSIETKKPVCAANGLAFDQSITERYVVTSFARIDNQREVLNKLCSDQEGYQSSSLSEIILKSYLFWGKECVHHLLGDWIFCIWNRYSKELFIARAPLGLPTIYYSRAGDTFLFSTNKKKLLSDSSVSFSKNSNAILQLGLGLPRDRQTFYENLHFLQCAHHLSLHKGKISIQNYWLPINPKAIHYANNEDYVEHFYHLYQEAVKCRLSPSNQGLALSSGLDSSSIAALIGENLRRKNQKLEAFCWKPSVVVNDLKISRNRIPDESQLARKLAQFIGDINVTVVDGRTDNFIDTIKKSLEVHNEPTNPNPHYYEILQKANSHNIQNLMTGYGGNYTVSYEGNILEYGAHLLKQLRWAEFLSWINRFRRDSEKSIINLMLLLFDKKIASPLKYSIWQNHNDLQVANCLDKGAISDHIHKYHQAHEAFNTQRIKYRTPYPISALLRFLYTNSLSNDEELHRFYNIEVTLPTLDKRLIEFCLGLPNDQFINHGIRKSLMKRAMKDKLPDYILHNHRRGIQGTDFITKVRHDQNRVVDLIQILEGSHSAQYWLDFEIIKRSYQELIMPLNSKRQKRLYINKQILSVGLGIGLYLLSQENQIWNE